MVQYYRLRQADVRETVLLVRVQVVRTIVRVQVVSTFLLRLSILYIENVNMTSLSSSNSHQTILNFRNIFHYCSESNVWLFQLFGFLVEPLDS
jgi:hypothetical protein